MNKVTKIIGLLAVIIIVGIIAYTLSDDKTNKDENQFKNEYEYLNNKKTKQAKTYINIEIPKDNNVTYADYKKTMSFLKEGTGILYIGTPENQNCRNLVPILIDVAIENEINDIYYYNISSIRDTKKLKDKKIVTTKKGSKKYYKLVDKLNKFLKPYKGLNDDSIKRIYFPTLIFVQGGKIVGSYTDTNESNESNKSLTKDQKKELNQTITKNINKIYGACDDSC